MPEAYRLNDYIIDGKGDPKELIKGMLVWPWDTQEMLDLVEWMRIYNNQHTRKIKFTGFDMQDYKGPLKVVIDIFNKYNSDFVRYSKDELVNKLNYISDERRKNYYLDGNIAARKCKKIIKHECHRLRKFAVEKIIDKNECDWFIQNVRVLEQNSNPVSGGSRDIFMAENLLWIKEHNPDSKILIWAHNGHIQKKYLNRLPMGHYLNEELKDKYLVVGFTFHEGTYNASGKSGILIHKAEKSYAGTYEYYFHSLNQPIFMLDLKMVSFENPQAQWLFKNLKFRWTGASPMENEFSPLDIVKAFDVIVFIDKTTNSTLIHEWKWKQRDN